MGCFPPKLFSEPCAYLSDLKSSVCEFPLPSNEGKATTASNQAKLKGNEAKANKLFELAGQKYAEALRIKPVKHDAFFNWGIALSAQAILKGNEARASELFELARQKYTETLRIKPEKHEAHFNLACIEGLKGNSERCCQYLKVWKKFHPNPTKMKLDNDSDFDRVRNSTEFQNFRNSLPD